MYNVIFYQILMLFGTLFYMENLFISFDRQEEKFAAENF